MDLAKANVVSPDHCFAEWRNVFVILWRRQTTMEGVERLMTLCRAFAAARPSFFLLTVVEPNAPLPESKVREKLADFLAEQGGKITRSAVVFEGHGFRAAAVRGVVTGLTMLARPPYPHRVFATATEASAWLAGEDHAATFEPRALMAALDDLRGALAAEKKTA